MADHPAPAKVLLVDDEPNMLAAYRRFLGKQFVAETAEDAESALGILAERGPFAVVVSDLHMPGMGGVEFLAAVRERYPDAVRVLVTGHARLQDAVNAVNEGHVFRFLTKPCTPPALAATVAAAAAQHELIVSDRRCVDQALRASEDLYRELFERNPYPVWVHDAGTLRFLAANAAAVAHFGFDRDRLLGMSLRDVEESPGHPAPAAPHHHGRLCRHRLASGEVRQVEVAGNPIEFAGRPACLVLAVDVTERKLLEEQLKQAQKLESIGQLAAGIAHEINTPVQYIGDNTHFLAGAFKDVGRVLDLYRTAAAEPGRFAEAERAAEDADLAYLLEEAPRAIEQTLEGVSHVARIVKAMKEFAHPGTEEKAPVDLNRTLETVVTVARNEWKYAAEVVTDLDPDLPPVPGLAGELNQVFLNLLVNAAHAVQAATSPGEKGAITITTRRAGGFVEVRVADTGCGIPEAIRGRVFDPFFTTKPVGQGTGQGLAIAHAVVVQRHGGAITFESEVGRGTTFVVRLPLAGDRLTQSQRVKAVSTIRVPPPATGQQP
jgi:PAS domain S-box-containing protein